MAAAESLSKYLYKVELYVLKIIPVILAGIFFLNTVLSYFDIDLIILSYIGGVSLLPILFLYLSSYVFKFCAYHRMPLHYIVLIWALNIIDTYIGIPVSDLGYLMILSIVTGIFLFIIIYLYDKYHKGTTVKSSL